VKLATKKLNSLSSNKVRVKLTTMKLNSLRSKKVRVKVIKVKGKVVPVL
jgi:hypothetical protein